MGRLFKKLINLTKKHLKEVTKPEQKNKEGEIKKDFSETENYEETNTNDEIKQSNSGFDYSSDINKAVDIETINIISDFSSETINLNQEKSIEKERYSSNNSKKTLKGNLSPIWRYISLSKQKINNEDLSLPVINLGLKHSTDISYLENPAKGDPNKYFLVEQNDIVCNFQDLEKISKKQATVYLWRGEGPAITSKKNFVFKANSQLTNSDFLYLAFKSDTFASKLSSFAYQNSSLSLLPWEKFKDLEINNFPDLAFQTKFLKKLEVLERLLKNKQDINNELEEWIGCNFELLKAEEEALGNKNFKEIFERFKITNKASQKAKAYSLPNIKSKFISSETNNTDIKGCELCNNNYCSIDKLLLSRNVYEGKEKKYDLKLFIGCEGHTTGSRFIPLTPKKEIGIPYGYYLLLKNLDKLITSITGATTKRTIDIKELEMCHFQIHHSPEKITKFNEICDPVFKHQQMLEEEIYKLKQLQNNEKEIIELKIFSNQISW